MTAGHRSIFFTTFATMEKSLKFPKTERLRHKRLVDRVFAEGKSVYSYPLRMVYRLDTRAGQLASFRTRHIQAGTSPDDTLRTMRIAPVQMMVSVPKRKMRHAVDRVLLRRRIREAWRINIPELRTATENTENTLSVALIYVGNEKHDYRSIETKMKKLIDVLAGEIRETGDSADTRDNA